MSMTSENISNECYLPQPESCKGINENDNKSEGNKQQEEQAAEAWNSKKNSGNNQPVKHNDLVVL